MASGGAGQEPDIMQISKVKIEEKEEEQEVEEPPQPTTVRIEVDEAPEADRISDSEGNEFIMHATGIESQVEAEQQPEVEGINPCYDIDEPEPVGAPVESPQPVKEAVIGISTESTVQGMNPDLSGPEPLGVGAGIEEPAIQAEQEKIVEGFNPNFADEPESIGGGQPLVSPGQVSEPDISATTESTVQGINPDLIMEPESIDDQARVEGPDVTETRIVSTGAQEVEAEIPPADTMFHREVEVTTETTSKRQTITMKSEFGMSPTTPTEPGRSPDDYSPAAEVTVAESAHETRVMGKFPSAAETLAEVGHGMAYIHVYSLYLSVLALCLFKI